MGLGQRVQFMVPEVTLRAIEHGLLCCHQISCWAQLLPCARAVADRCTERMQ
jgi:hypothetical protein